MGSSADASSTPWTRWGSTSSVNQPRDGRSGDAVSGGPGPALLVFGGIHGDEPASVEALIELAARLAAGSAATPPVWLLPAVNPDGVARGRKNSAHDVDLNRNFPARSFVTEARARVFPRPGPAVGAGDARDRRPRRARANRRRGGRPCAVRLRQLRRAGRPLGAGRGGAPAAGRRAPTSATPPRGRSGAGWASIAGLPVLTLELPPGPLSGVPDPCRGRPGRVNPRRTGV